MCGSIHGDAASTFVHVVSISADRCVFVGALVSRTGSHVFLHLAQISGVVPPGWLEVLPSEGEHTQHSCIGGDAKAPPPHSEHDKQSEWNSETQHPAPGELHEAQLGK